MKITGELLKSERIKLKLSQQDIAFALKLSTRIINAIEAGDVENLPAKTFVRGFVKSYAEMLKLDSTLVLNQYHEEMGTVQPMTKVISVPSENAKAKATNFSEATTTKPNDISTVTPNLKMNLNRNTFKIVALITIAVIVIGGINQVINKYQKEGSMTEPQKLSVEVLNQEANAPKETTPAILSADLVSKESAVAPTPNAAIPLPDGSAPPLVEQKETVAKEPVVEKAPEKPVEKIVEKPTGKPIELVIEANKDTTISYATGSENDFKKLDLKKNTFQIIKSKTGLHLKMKEGNAISITVNGINKGLASEDAKPLELSF